MYNLFPHYKYTEYPLGYTNQNYSLEEVTEQYNETGLINTNTRVTPTFEYNEGGYPTRIVGQNVDTYTYLKY